MQLPISQNCLKYCMIDRFESLRQWDWVNSERFDFDMKRFFKDLPPVLRMAAILMLVVAILAMLVVASKDILTKAILAVLAATLTSGAVRLATPQEVRVLWLRHVSLTVASGFVGGVIFWKNFVESLLGSIIGRFVSDSKLPVSSDLLVVLAFFFLFAVIVVINHPNRMKTATIRTRKTLLDHPDTRADRDQLIEELCRYIESLDQELSWRHEDYIELEADIDLVLGNDRRRSAGNLLKAVRENTKARLFMVLGDPGSGKSVALRTLTRVLLQEVDEGGQIPIYINLREWRLDPSKDWDGASFSDDSLEDFVLRFLRKQLSPMSREFLDKHFKTLQQEGQFFFILDSFDEIPAILDSNESSALIRELSKAIYQFILSGLGARGLVASRYFRRPTVSRRDRCLLELRPFNEARIAELIVKQAAKPERLQERIFRESALLGTLARSPFLLSLILDYEKYHSDDVPENQAALFKSYIEQVFARARSEIESRRSECPDLNKLCHDIANLMFERPELGLEVSVQELRDGLSLNNLALVIEVLQMFRFFRISKTNHLSFAHRRFQEYFLVQKFVEKPAEAPLEAITEDSRWRDSVVLYAEIAPEGGANGMPGEAEKIAAYCLLDGDAGSCQR